MHELTTANFHSVVDSASTPVLVDFNASWCGPCQMQAPILEDLAKEATGRYQIFSLDIDSSPDIAREYEVSSIPCLVVFKNGEEFARKVGMQSTHTLEKLLTKAAK